ncbi:hypothetical protein RHMOL_Rhmol11G0285500 [Rhododendron molle]|uniref:Uncharacterized protein n=2 Tax=Rhododendron molle TaxID=49168 RepID=A0ACC0LY53_RHOML|nr:hypothetical protein RHMOL_Rhmol11G0285500 [Rhododendron molle]KAI8533282.1 hypothetical protein RHMOL_Rhmol11G0285500 [Rhododendron molle]
MAIVMALLSGFAGVYTEAIIKKRPSRNINVQNFWLYVFGMGFNAIAILIQDFDAVMNKGFFHGYSLITTVMIINHALRPSEIILHKVETMAVYADMLLSPCKLICLSMVMKYADNIVKVRIFNILVWCSTHPEISQLGHLDAAALASCGAVHMGRVEGKAEESNFVLHGCRMVDTSLEGFMDFVDSVAPLNLTGVFYFSGNAADCCCFCVSIWVSSLAPLFPWLHRCVRFDISTLHREDAKIVMTCIGSRPNCVVNGGANILSVVLRFSY